MDPTPKMSPTPGETDAATENAEAGGEKKSVWPDGQLDYEGACAFFEERRWEPMTFAERARFQIDQERLCMPFDVLHEAVEKTLGRPVWTHEFADRDRLRRQIFGDDTATPTMDEIMEMIPAHKRIAVAS